MSRCPCRFIRDMRKLILILFIIIGISCNRVKYNDSEVYLDRIEFFENIDDPYYIIDSISIADSINNMSIKFDRWNRVSSLTSDSVFQETFYFYDEESKTMISVFKIDNKYQIKHTKGE